MTSADLEIDVPLDRADQFIESALASLANSGMASREGGRGRCRMNDVEIELASDASGSLLALAPVSAPNPAADVKREALRANALLLSSSGTCLALSAGRLHLMARWFPSSPDHESELPRWIADFAACAAALSRELASRDDAPAAKGPDRSSNPDGRPGH